MADATGVLLQQLLDRAAEKTVVVAMGNPYLAADFPKIENYMCTFSNATVSEISGGQSAVRRNCDSWASSGEHSQTLPQRGAGIERPVRRMPVEDLNMRRNKLAIAFRSRAGLATLLLLPACSVNVKKEANGQDKQVDIKTLAGRRPRQQAGGRLRHWSDGLSRRPPEDKKIPTAATRAPT